MSHICLKNSFWIHAGVKKTSKLSKFQDKYMCCCVHQGLKVIRCLIIVIIISFLG